MAIKHRPSAPHYMIDIETTGLIPTNHAITSIAVVQFHPQNFDVLDVCNMAVLAPPDRAISDRTLDWRTQNGVDEMEAHLGERKHWILMMQSLLNFIEMDGIVWAKPAKFDIAFLESYFNDYWFEFDRSLRGIYPWHYRDVIDLASFVAGTGARINELEKECRRVNKYKFHDALGDCLFQIDVLKLAVIGF